jgi:hypothetical protein
VRISTVGLYEYATARNIHGSKRISKNFQYVAVS